MIIKRIAGTDIKAGQLLYIKRKRVYPLPEATIPIGPVGISYHDVKKGKSATILISGSLSNNFS